MAENDQTQNLAILCPKQCGFYGSPTFDGLCSQCHRIKQKQAENTQEVCSVAQREKFSGANCASRNSVPDDHSPKRETPTSDKVSSDSPSDTSVERDSDSAVSVPERDAPKPEDAAVDGLSDPLINYMKVDSKPGSPASTCSDETTTKIRHKCATCRKRVGLTGFSCRCGGLFCAAHRYSDKHDCIYDYRESGQQEIRRSNPKVVCQKVQKI